MAMVMQAAGAVEGATQAVVGIADAAAHIQDVARDQAAKAKEAARNNENEFNIRKNFLDNTVDAIRKATLSQYNIVIRTDQEHDDFQNLTGEILPMDLIEVEVATGKPVNFQVSVFDTGKYLRHGKWERDHWWWWGSTKTWTDPAAMHVHFEKAQPKIDPNTIKQQQDKKAADDKIAADTAAAAKAAQDKAAQDKAAQDKAAQGKAAQGKAAANSAAALKAEANRKFAESQNAQYQAPSDVGGQPYQTNPDGPSPGAGSAYGGAASQILAPFGTAILPHVGQAFMPLGQSFLKSGL